MRFYRLKHKETGKICTGIKYSLFKVLKKSPLEIDWKVADNSGFIPIGRLNSIIEDIYRHNLSAELDNMILENAERTYTIIPGTVRLKTIRNRLEQKAIINKLKYGQGYT